MEFAAHDVVHPNQAASKTQLPEDAAAIFGGTAIAADGKEQIRELREKIGETTIDRNLLSNALGKFSGFSGKRLFNGAASWW